MCFEKAPFCRKPATFGYQVALWFHENYVLSLFLTFISFFYVLVPPAVLLNCSSPTTLKKGEGFICECQGTDSNPPANVTWYKDNTKIITGKKEAILSLRNVDKDDNGTYRCEARTRRKAKNKISVELIVIRKYIVDTHSDLLSHAVIETSS